MASHGFTLAHWCVLAAALMPILCAGIAKSGQFRIPRSQGGYDNRDPRAWLARQTDWRARANAAQANCFEAMPFFIGAVVIAQLSGAPSLRVGLLALVWVVLRLVYVLLYVADQATARSAVWSLALAVNIGILFAGGI